MLKLVRILMALLAGELVVDMTVNTDKFPFHGVWNGIQTTLRLESRHLENGTICRSLWTEMGTIPHHLSVVKIIELILALSLKGSVQNFYGGISLKLVTPSKIRKINVLNAVLVRFGYVTLGAVEHNNLRSVMALLNNRNKSLQHNISDLKQQVQSHEELLGTFCIQNRNMADAMTSLRCQLDATQDEVYKLKAQSEAICTALGIQSVDEFLHSVLPAKSASVDARIEPFVNAPDLESLSRSFGE